ncbi:uncharacterized protein A1O5_08872, partial [Cladophialophora psammophila CBS 110553]
KRFKDTIFVTRSLGIQLRWIGSLCIFRDSRDGLEREVPLTSSVYRYALLNLAASAAVDDRVGCLPARNPSQIKPCTIQTEWLETITTPPTISTTTFSGSLLLLECP